MRVSEVVDGVEGWCTLTKAEKLYALASEPSCHLAVEIGVFGGKSLFPVALAFKDKAEGCIYGVEPWDNDVATESSSDANDAAWWRTVDLNAIKAHFFDRLTALGLSEHVRILEIPSDVALRVFDTRRYQGRIDVVHIDGNHSVAQSVYDVALWHALVRPGGHIVLDDINWASVRLAYEYLSRICDSVAEFNSDEEGHFAIFRKVAPQVPLNSPA